MIERIRNWLRRLTGISTPFGGLSWNASNTHASSMPILSDPIHITYNANDPLLSFLQTHDGQIVCVSTYIDASVTLREQWEYAERHQIDLESIGAGTFSGVSLPLPNSNNELLTAIFHFRNDRVLTYSTGGTGMLTVPIKGFFALSRTFHSGPTVAFHFTEVDAPFEAKIDLLNRTKH